MKYPSRKQAEEVLQWALSLNPGPWEQHSRHAARAAEAIAARCSLDPDKAFVLALLHDIGRYEGVRALLHVIAGYRLMKERGWDDVARICLTHSFPVPDCTTFNGALDCTDDEIAFIDHALDAMVYDDYDRLIQLCDALATADGITTIEKRLIDVALRNGIGERYREKWHAFLDIKRDFDARCGCNIYTLFRDDIENTIFA